MSFAAMIARDIRIQNKELEHFIGLLNGLVCDRVLAKQEIDYLDIWLREHPGVTGAWPGNIIHAKLQEVMRDGIVTDAERQHLLEVISSVAGNSFAETGAAAPEVAEIEFNDDCELIIPERCYCFTGEFVFGTRAECERAIERRGGFTKPSFSKKVHYLVVGSIVSPAWVHTSFGRKIQAAMELRQSGHALRIVSENRWSSVLT